MNWYFEVLNKYAVFNGRARRKEYWFFVLFNVLISLLLSIADGLTGTLNPLTGVGVLGGVYMIAIMIPSIAVAVRRLHDTGRSGWWLLISLIPVVGGLVLLYFLVLDSDPESNEYGECPKNNEYSA